MNEEEYLIHYGVLGMKWGVRKKRAKSAAKVYYRSLDIPLNDIKRNAHFWNRRLNMEMGLSIQEIKQGRYAVAKFRNNRAKAIGSAFALGTGAAAAKLISMPALAGVMATPTGLLAGVGAISTAAIAGLAGYDNKLSGGSYWAEQARKYKEKR